MQSFRTSSIFKFTSDFELLKRIIRDGIIPNYCEEDLSFGTPQTEFCLGIPMSSFCDIPMTLLDEHNKRYGNYGIALSKDWGIENGIQPVMYIANESVLKSVYYHYYNEKKVRDWYQRKDVQQSLNQDTIVKGFPLEDFAKIKSAEIGHAYNTHIIGYLKKYKSPYKGDIINNYEENEWRYIVPEQDETKWFWTRQEYMAWRNPLGKDISKVKKPSPSKAIKVYTLKFTENDVKYILVKDEEFKGRIIEFINKLTTIGGNPITMGKSTYSVNSLLTKIVTLEQVQKDF